MVRRTICWNALVFVARARTLMTVIVALVMLLGCAGGLRLTPIKSTQEKPSNVAVYFRVENSAGEPMGGLTADKFRIYEDAQIVSPYESKQTILNPTVAASHYTLLLIDMSGSISQSGGAQAVVEAATAFTEHVEKHQKVGVYAFDGSEDLYPISSFTNSAGSATAAVKSLGSFKGRDPSTNLNGAIVKGLKELETALSHAEHPLRFGTLVVFTDGTDHAARVSADEMRKAVADSSYEVFAIGLGAEIQEPQLKQVGKNGTAMAADRSSVKDAFGSIAQRIEATTKSYYLLSYCSPARAGEHEVQIEAVVADADGKNERTGRLAAQFDATGFQPGCDPNRAPSFDTSKGEALLPKQKDKGKDQGESKKASIVVSTGEKKPRSPATGDAQPKPVKPGNDFNP